MTNSIAIPDDPNDKTYDGKAMSSLTARKRKFVIAMLEQGVNPRAAGKAAVASGYSTVYGYELMRDEGILAALREEATKRLAGAALTGVNVLLDIAQSPTHKDQFRAAKELAGINGFTAEQRIVVEHLTEDTKSQMRQIYVMAAQLGMDPKQLIKSAGIVDAEFTEIDKVMAEPQVDDSDW